ncbi:flippase [Calidithermus timidus]|jgi:O-antigen/teichoic acid export membrane protein|uniref:flippase n=1 Tax=Calidithermus timidus TaxID=307124 RepID=UPI00039EBA84|nr:flippase [Calidithermus timidus]
MEHNISPPANPPRLARVVRNGLWNGASNLLVALAGIVTSVIVARSLSEAQFGVYSYYAWLSGTLVALLNAQSFGSALTKLAAELRGRGEVGEARALGRGVMLVLVGSSLLLSIAVLIYALGAEPPLRYYFLVVAAAPLPGVLASLLSSVFWSRENYRVTSIANLLGAGLQVALVLVAYWRGWGVAGYLLLTLALPLTNCIALLLTSSADKSEGDMRRWWPSRSTVRYYLQFSFPLAVMGLLELVMIQRSGVLFLEFYSTTAEIGFYSLAYTIFQLLFMTGWALVNSFYPAISHSFGQGDWTTIRHKVRQAGLLSAVYATPLFLGGLVTLPELIALLFGVDKIEAARPAQVLFLGMLPMCLVGLYGLTLNAINRPWAVFPIGIGASLLGIGLSVWLVPQHGAVGAAIANTVAQGTYAGLKYLIVRRLVGVGLPWGVIAQVLFIGFLSAFLPPLLSLRLFPGAPGLLLGIALSAVAYVGAMWRLGYLRRIAGESPAAPGGGGA